MHPNTYSWALSWAISWALSWAMAVAALCSLANPTPARAEKTADLDTALETLLTADLRLRPGYFDSRIERTC